MGSGECPILMVRSDLLTVYLLDDSIMLATPSLVATSSSSLSSDDDPHKFAGQVTPHRVISPSILLHPRDVGAANTTIYLKMQ